MRFRLRAEPGGEIPAPQPVPPPKETTFELALFVGGKWSFSKPQSTDDLASAVAGADMIWLNVDGKPDEATLSAVGKALNVAPEILKRAVDEPQRPKADFEDGIAIGVLRMARLLDRVVTEQLSLVASRKFVVTFQNGPAGDCLDYVRGKLKAGWKPRQDEASDYVAAVILDTVVDSYFPILEELGERLNILEEDVLKQLDGGLPPQLHEVRRDVLSLRRVIYPLREAIAKLLRDDEGRMSKVSRAQLKESHEAAIMLMELVELHRELGSNLMDLHLSSTSNHMNQVMKVLTIITSLFIPPAFIASIYGMNFNVEKSPLNMPELNWFYGYPFALGVMAVMMLGLMLFLWWKGYLRTGRRFRRRIWRRRSEDAT